MPSGILILLIVAAAGVVGSIALLVCNAVLGKRSAVQANEKEYDPIPEAEEETTAAPEEVRKIKFTPLDAEETVHAMVEEEEPATETAAMLHLVKPEEHAERNSTVVRDICLSIGNAQDIGQRAQQQDAFAITPLEEGAVVASHGVMAVVCDGMGGMENGAEAAGMGAVQFMRAYLASENAADNALVDAVYAANDAVYRAFQGKDGKIAGTTLAAASILPDGLRFVSVGDSHIYLFRKNKLYQLNRDHNYFSELLDQVRAGSMTLEEAQRHPERAHLTSYVGIEKLELVDYNVEPVDLRKGDRVLICSDGLFKTLSLQEITQIVASAQPYAAQDALLGAVKARNKRKQDNVTVVVLYCDEK